jgi:hypothetical protein
MMAGLRYGKLVGVVIATSMFVSSTGAVAATSPAPSAQISPWAALAALSGGAPSAVLCGGAAAAAAAAQTAAPGCVLPAVDNPAPVTEAAPPQPIPVPPVEPAGGGLGLGMSPLLLGLAAVAAGVALYFALHHKHHANSPA